MPTEVSPRLELPYLQPSQAQKHVTHNEALQRLDAVTQLSVVRFGSITPPALPSEGEAHALGAGALDAWAGQGSTIAVWDGTVWRFVTPKDGWRAWGAEEQELRVWVGGTWEPVRGDVQNLDGVGVGTTSDASNRLAVASDASLFSHDGAGHQLKINKNAAADTASMLFQSDWTGHAEMGLAGDTDFAIKISPDGSSWIKALSFDATSGQASGAAVQANSTDATAGALMKVGAFGLGATLAQSSDFNTESASGLFVNASASTPGAPTAVSNWHVINLYNAASVRTQIAFRPDDMRWRRYSSGSWQPWVKIMDHDNVAGTVSGTASAPTGALFEYGSNANGEYARYANGVQMCWKRFSLTSQNINTPVGALYSSGNLMSGNTNFAANFAAIPTCTYSVEPTATTAMVKVGGPATTTRFVTTFYAIKEVAVTGITIDVCATAVGRWI